MYSPDSSFRPIDSEISCIPHLIDAWMQRMPDAPAIIFPGRAPLTYRRLFVQADYVVKTLRATGVGRSDRVAVVLPNGAEMAVAVLTVASGAVCVPLNPAYRINEFETYFSDLKIKALLLEAGRNSAASAAALACEIPIIEISPKPEEGSGIFTFSGDERPPPADCGFNRPDDVALLFQTSGTTSRPKIVPLTHTNLCVSARVIGASLDLTTRDRCLNMMPLFHIHGVVGSLFSSITAGSSIVCAPGFQPSMFFEWLKEFRPTWYSAVPTLHQAILETASHRQDDTARSSLRFIRSSSAPLSPAHMGELERVFQVPVIEAYGMTEASHQIASNSLPPGRRKPGSVGMPTGTKVAIIDEARNFLSNGEIGEILIRGESVFRGYENNPEANADAFAGGWLRTGDEGYLDDDGYLFIRARLDEIINRGGLKMSPGEIERALLKHPALTSAVAFAVPHPTLGEDVAAAVVLRKDVSITEQEIRDFAAVYLAEFKVPRRVLILDEIPTNAIGKLRRKDLALKLGLASTTRRPEFVQPRDSLELHLTRMWEELFQIRPIGVADNFFDLGGDSLRAINLIAQLEKTYKKNLPPNAIYLAPTVERLADLLRKKESAGPLTLLTPLKSQGVKPPFFCVYVIASWARFMPSDQPFYALQPHGVDGRGAPRTVEEMAADYIKEIRAVQPDGPYYLGGYSFGGVVAFEIAQQLRMQNQHVALLVLFDPASPNFGVSGHFLRKVTRFSERVGCHMRSLVSFSPKEKLAYVLKKIREKAEERIKQTVCWCYVMAGRKVPVFLRTFYFLEARRRALLGYVPRVYPYCLIVFQAKKRAFDSRPVWSKLVSGGVTFEELPGSHLDIGEQPNAQSWAERLCVYLRRAQDERGI